MTDKELLELAAKAAGYKAKWFGDVFYIEQEGDIYRWHGWFPLHDDGAALRLAVKLNLNVLTSSATVVKAVYPNKVLAKVSKESDPYAATRRAIVRAAAAIGETL